jgi:hypothetical protein
MRKSLSILLATAGAAFAFSAHAESPTIAGNAFASSATRAQVQAELATFRSSGSNPWATSYNPLRSFASSKTRHEVISEFVSGREQVAQMTREDSGSQLLSQAQRAPGKGSFLAQRASRQP